MKRMKSLPPPPTSTVKKYGARYPWALWFKRGTFTLIQGRDYLIEPHGMRGMIYNRASALGVRVRLTMAGGTITARVEDRT